MKTFKTFPTLVAKNKGGLNKYWTISIAHDNGRYFICTSWDQTLKDGSISATQTSEPYEVFATNVGRANEREAKEQAIFECESIIKKQRRLGFRETTEPEEAVILPMLAHKFKDHIAKVTYPTAVQPKLNGIRMLFNGAVGKTRGNKDVISEVINHLEFDFQDVLPIDMNIWLDGELLLPGNVLLQETMKSVKKFRPESSPNLQYYVYDIIVLGNPSMNFIDRYKLVSDIVKQINNSNIILTPTNICTTQDEIMSNHSKFCADGFEGTMVRDILSKYEINKRSYGLLKLKDFLDDEFKIVDIIDGEGRDKELAIFICETNDGSGRVFNCRPEGGDSLRRMLYEDRDKHIGEYLTIRYQELSADSVPLFPVGIAVRSLGDFK